MRWRDFPKIVTADSLNEYLDEREYSHGGYFHYTRLGVAENIIRNREFWLSCVSGFNDTIDIQQFGEEAEDYYSLCFSTGLHENLPLWYLYSGVDGQGARIRFTKKAIRKLIEEGRYYLYDVYNEGNVLKLGDQLMELKNGTTMYRNFKDVIYSSGRSTRNIVDLKYNTMTNHVMPVEEWETYLKRAVGFRKGLIWYYEKETRLLVQLIGEAREIHKKSQNCKVVLRFDSQTTGKAKQVGMRITLAPNVTNNNLREVLEPYPCIHNLVTGHALSEYSGTIKIDVCRGCVRKIV